ncbi:MAG: GTPase (G3E family) [Lachnospiraceae bacterium]|nr:GTPase (G3E family) [Lachnospiraceae bacterium]
MIQIDLITGFLGAGKTTFIKEYTRAMNAQGKKVGIIENDFGGVNVDMLLLKDLQNPLCVSEQILSDGDPVTYKRRLKAKLIAMSMQGFQRIIIEPSGIFDMDAFLDTLYDEPVCNWYELANVIAIVDAHFPETISKESAYMMTSQIAHAGKIVFSKCQDTSAEDLLRTKDSIKDVLAMYKCSRILREEDYLAKDWKTLTAEDFQNLFQAGYKTADYGKVWMDQQKQFGSLAFLELGMQLGEVKEVAKHLFAEPAFGNVLRVKGLVKGNDSFYQSYNFTRNEEAVDTMRDGQEVLVVIGENLCKEQISALFSK